MSRRSTRLMSGGYYNSDEESDSSTVTNISYRENPVKVFKKKSGGRKSGSRTPSKTTGNARAETTKTTITEDQYDALTPSSPSSQSQVTMRTVPYSATAPTPRPALTPSTRSQTPARCPSVPPETSLRSAHCTSGGRAGLHFRPSHKEPGQSGVDSSGYSSSEGAYGKPGPVAFRATGGAGAAHSAGYRSRIVGAFDSLMASATSVTAAAHSKLLHLTALAANASLGARMKKACGLVLLLLLALLCVWLLLPFFASFISRMNATKISSASSPPSSVSSLSSPPSSISSSSVSSSSSASSSQAKPLSPPVVPATPSPQPSVVFSTPVVDPAVVSAAVDAKMERILMDLQLKQERLLAQIRQKLQGDMQDMKAKLEAANSGSWQQLDQEVSGLSRQMAGYQTDSQSAATSLNLRIQKLEAQNVQLSQELSSIQLTPPPAPCPEPAVAPVADQLTPELQQAMERWFTDRIKEQDAIRLAEKGGCSDCGRPLADKMPDFALESQGASVVSTRCSETYRIRSACVTLFGFPLWYPSESPRTVIQGYPVLLPGKCWAFHGVQGTLVISLSHPVRITHVTLDHLPRYNSPTGRIDSAPKDFEVYGMKNDTEEGTLLGTFTYDEDGESTQTFELLNPSDAIYRFVELRVLTNWGHVEYTCLYRFRVHGKMEST